MYLVTSDPGNYDVDFSKHAIPCQNLQSAEKEATRYAAYYGRAHIYRLEKIKVAVGDTPCQSYKNNEKGEILPCD